MRLPLLACLSSLSMGCSFIFVRPPPSEPDQLPYFDCVSSSAAPATDVTNVVADGLLVASALDQHEPGFATGVAITGAVYAASAIYGFVMTSKCESAKERLAARVHATRVQLDGLLKVDASPATPSAGCLRDLDCKGERLCVDARCVNPPLTPPTAPAVQAPALPPLTGGATPYGPRSTPTPAPAPAPSAAPAGTTP